MRKAFGDNLLIENLDFKLPPGGIVGVIGPNGAGKSTLFKMILEQEKPDQGSLRIGDTVKIGYVDQSRDKLDSDKNVWEEISGGRMSSIWVVLKSCRAHMLARSTSRAQINRKSRAPIWW